MSRLYDAAEPGVLDENLLHFLIIEQGPDGEAGKIIEKEGIEFDEVTELRIDFKNIQQIENLWQLKNLVKLRLDNNIISCINGLDQLVNLEWLDLSFNNIKEIQGLENLTKLKDLSLAHNFITEVGGLDSLKDRLQVLSIGYNELHNLQATTLYLRRFSSLQSLCLRGNKFSSVSSSSQHANEDYRHYQLYCIALIPTLVYLDYQIIFEEIVRKKRGIAQEQQFDLLQELEIKEREERHKLELTKANQEKHDHYMASYINGLDGEEFYHSLFEEDTEFERFSLLPGEVERLEQYYKEVVNICKEIVQIGLDEEEKRRRERESFYTAHKNALESNQAQSVNRIQQYENEKEMLLAEHQTESFGEKITELHHDIMKLEMQLVDQYEEIFKEFERNYTEMVNHLFEAIQAKTTQLRDYEKNHYETILELCTQLLEAYSKGQLEEDLPEKLKILFVDKDTLMGAINSSHDTHMMVIDNKEDSIRSRAEKDKRELLDDIVQKEYKRNRQRVTEITQYIDLQHEELEDWLSGTKE